MASSTQSQPAEQLDAAPEGPVTTLMLRNVPRTYTVESVIAELTQAGMDGRYDFLYLPWDTRRDSNISYVFVNFPEPDDVQRCFNAFSGRAWTYEESPRTCRVATAHIQGVAQNLHHYIGNTRMQDKSLNAPLVYKDGKHLDLQEALDIFCPNLHQEAPCNNPQDGQRGSSTWDAQMDRNRGGMANATNDRYSGSGVRGTAQGNPHNSNVGVSPWDEQRSKSVGARMERSQGGMATAVNARYYGIGVGCRDEGSCVRPHGGVAPWAYNDGSMNQWGRGCPQASNGNVGQGAYNDLYTNLRRSMPCTRTGNAGLGAANSQTPLGPPGLEGSWERQYRAENPGGQKGNAGFGAMHGGGALSEGNSVMAEVADFKRCFEDFCGSLQTRGGQAFPILREIQASALPNKDVQFWANFFQICLRYGQANADEAARNQPRMPTYHNFQDEFSQPMQSQSQRSQPGPMWRGATSDSSQVDEFPMPSPRDPQLHQMDARQQRIGCYGNSGCSGSYMGGSNGTLIVSRYDPSPDIDIPEIDTRNSCGSGSLDPTAGPMRAHVSIQPPLAAAPRVQEWTLPNLDNMVLERFQELSECAPQPGTGPCLP